jgi:hypothetical protein
VAGSPAFTNTWNFLAELLLASSEAVLRRASGACCLGPMVRLESGRPAVLQPNGSSILINLIFSC